MKSLFFCLFLVLPLFACPADSIWSQTQIDSAIVSGTAPILWAESNIYGGLNPNNVPVNPVSWDKLSAYASLPVQPIIRQIAVDAKTQVLKLHRPESISNRFLYFYDAELTNVIYVENRSQKWANRFFDLHFLEDIFVPLADPKVNYRNNRAVNDNLFMWSRPAGHIDGISRDEWLFYMIQSASIYFECAGHIWVEGNQMFWETIVVNHSDFNWDQSETWAPGALMCFRTRNNPDFDDQLGQRIFYYYANGSKAKSVYDTDGYSGIYYHQWAFPPDCIFSAKLTKYNQAGNLWVDVESNPGESAGGNRDQSMSCIHANVGWSIPKCSWQKINFTATFREYSRADEWSIYE